MHQPNPYSHPGRAAAKPSKPTRASRGLHSMDNRKVGVHGNDDYQERQNTQSIIEIDHWNSHMSLIIGKGTYSQ